jgi:DNA-binding CsgD family transcriptional regulator
VWRTKKSYLENIDRPLTQRQRQIVELYLNGKRQKDIAIELHVTQATVSSILNSASVAHYLRTATNKKLTSGRAKAVDKLLELLEDESPWVRLQAIRVIFDQVNLMDKGTDTTLVVKFPGMDEPPGLPDSSEVEADGSVE